MKCRGCEEDHKKSELTICHGCRLMYCEGCQEDHSPCYLPASAVWVPSPVKTHKMNGPERKKRKKKTKDSI